MNGDVWQAIEALVRNAPEWEKTCGRMVSGLADAETIRGRHVSWYDGIGGDVADAFDQDVGTMLGQFTLASASKKRGMVDQMVKATQRLFHTARLSTADMEVGHMHVARFARVQRLVGKWEAQLDVSIVVQGASQVPAFAGRG